MDVEINHSRRQVFDDYIEISMKFVGSHTDADYADPFGPAPAEIDHIPILPGSYRNVRPSVADDLDQRNIKILEDSICAHVGRSRALDVCVPESYDEAKKSEEWHLWRSACNAELAALRDNDTYAIVPRTPDMDVMGSSWDFSIEDDGMRRAKMVAKTKRQLGAVPYEITSSPVPRFDAIRFFFSLATRNRFSVTHMKFNAAYFNLKLNDDLYVQPPPGFLVGGKKVGGNVLKLKKIIEGLSRAPYGRDRTISRELKALGFSPAGHGMCFYHKSTGYDTILITVSEEDMFIGAKDAEKIKQVKNKLVAKFHMRDLGSPKKVRGMNVECHENHTIIHLGNYIDSLLRDYQMEECTPRKIPSNGYSLRPPEMEDGDPYHDIDAYRSLVAKLLYAAMTVRYDIVNIVCDLCRFLQNPHEKHWEAAINVVRYLKGTKSVGITYKFDARVGMYCFSGAEEIESREGEFFGYITTYAGSPVFWKCTYVPISEEYDISSDDDLSDDMDDSDDPDAEYGSFSFGFGFGSGFGYKRHYSGFTHGTSRSHRKALRAAVRQSAWSGQILRDIDLSSFFSGYSGDSTAVSRTKALCRHLEPKVKNRSGQYVTPPGVPDEHLAVFLTSECHFTENTNPAKLIVLKLSNTEHNTALRILNFESDT